MSTYPGALKTFTNKTNKVDLYDSAHVNALQDEVVAVQTELGTDPAGSCTDLKTRLYVCIGNDGAMRQGTSFPGSPIEGQLFYRSDEHVPYYYNGTGWELYEQVRLDIFTSDGNWVAPAGITKVYITAVGGGGGGGSGSGNSGGGGGGGGMLIKYPYTVVGGNTYAVDIGAGGAGGSIGGADGAAGANTTFDTAVIALGGAKGEGSTGGSAGGLGAGGFDAVTSTSGGYNLKGGNGAITAGGGTLFGPGAIVNHAATANTGAGGGGGGDGSPGYAGGSGLLIVEW